MSLKNLMQKILEKHLVKGKLIAGEEIAIKIDQTLTQDATGTMAYLQFEAMGIPRVKTKLSVSYVDHNILQSGFENADDHKFLQTIAAKYGIYFSKPGNGICHQVHLERFGVPGMTLLGSDSHTQTAGGLGMIGIGAGGLDVALAMGGQPFYLMMPKIVKVNLSGRLKPWVNARDIAFELLKRLTVKGGVGKVFEFVGEGTKNLSVPERAVITNLCTELGATSSIFPSDAVTKEFLKSQKREKHWIKLSPDANCFYNQEINIDLRQLEPMVASPHSPDNIQKVREIAGLKVDQVCIGSCANSSLRDLMIVASILKGKKVHPDVSLTISPGSKQVLEMITRDGALAELIKAGARILECACGPCIGMGQAPRSNGISIRTFTRNFPGRSGTENASLYLISPEIAAASAIKGELFDPRKLGKMAKIFLAKKFIIDDAMIIPPSKHPQKIEIYRGPNIKPLPKKEPLPDSLTGKILIKVGDNISTDDIMPAGAKILPLRSNIPAISEYVFERIDKGFVRRAKEEKGGFIVGGNNYGQGSSREHAALAPMYLGIKAVIVKSFARIHRANLINFGLLPFTLENENDYEKLLPGDEIEIHNLKKALRKGKKIVLKNITKGYEIILSSSLTQRQIEIILAGGALNIVQKIGRGPKKMRPVPIF